jgi:hypothetical protein
VGRGARDRGHGDAVGGEASEHPHGPQRLLDLEDLGPDPGPDLVVVGHAEQAAQHHVGRTVVAGDGKAQLRKHRCGIEVADADQHPAAPRHRRVRWSCIDRGHAGGEPVEQRTGHHRGDQRHHHASDLHRGGQHALVEADEGDHEDQQASAVHEDPEHVALGPGHAGHPGEGRRAEPLPDHARHQEQGDAGEVPRPQLGEVGVESGEGEEHRQQDDGREVCQPAGHLPEQLLARRHHRPGQEPAHDDVDADLVSGVGGEQQHDQHGREQARGELAGLLVGPAEGDQQRSHHHEEHGDVDPGDEELDRQRRRPLLTGHTRSHRHGQEHGHGHDRRCGHTDGTHGAGRHALLLEDASHDGEGGHGQHGGDEEGERELGRLVRGAERGDEVIGEQDRPDDEGEGDGHRHRPEGDGGDLLPLALQQVPVQLQADQEHEEHQRQLPEDGQHGAGLGREQAGGDAGVGTADRQGLVAAQEAPRLVPREDRAAQQGGTEQHAADDLAHHGGLADALEQPAHDPGDDDDDRHVEQHEPEHLVRCELHRR